MIGESLRLFLLRRQMASRLAARRIGREERQQRALKREAERRHKEFQGDRIIRALRPDLINGERHD